jgi:hypothetical protein
MAKYGTSTYGQATYGAQPEPCGCCCRPIVNLTITIKKIVLMLCPDPTVIEK